LPAATPPARPPTARPAATDLKRVEITGTANTTAERRQSTAAKIVVGREEIEQFGDNTLSEVLKRLPSVTIGGRPGRGGQIRMRGMGGGYTQILIDGERAPPGFAIDQLTPDQVERIEIYRAPTAETGARAIAGTINIVLREPLRQRGDDLRLGLGVEHGRLQPNVSWSRNDAFGSTGTYGFNLSLSRIDQVTETRSLNTTTDLASGATLLRQQVDTRQTEQRHALNLNGRVQWKLGEGDQLSIQPFLVLTDGERRVRGRLEQTVGAAAAPYATSATEGSGRSAIGRLSLQWRQRLAESTRLELRGYVGSFQSDTSGVLNQFDAAGNPGLVQATDTTIRDRSFSVTGKLSHLLVERHSLVAGWEIEGLRRDENQGTSIDGVDALADFGGSVRAATRRLAVYLQDEWDPSPQWSAYAGLRWEGLATSSRSETVPVDNRSHVLTPLLHAVWRFDAPRRDQVRFSLTRSYRPPTLQNLIALPSLSTLYPAPGPNTASSPDRAGNPALLPEVARGVDIALERYLPAGGVVSASVFRRNIANLIRTVTSLETVSWAAAPRYVARPQNLGDAVSQGIELDAKFRLEDMVDSSLPLSLRTNLALYRSRVEGVPGPDNRIDQQPRVSGNVGGDYWVTGLPLTIGASLAWTPPYAVQQTEAQRVAFELKRVVDAYALWTLGPGTRLRLSLANLVPRAYVTTSGIVDGGRLQTVAARGPTTTLATLRLEMRL
jgi:iron complex outermembrane receptor protein